MHPYLNEVSAKKKNHSPDQCDVDGMFNINGFVFEKFIIRRMFVVVTVKIVVFVSVQ